MAAISKLRGQSSQETRLFVGKHNICAEDINLCYYVIAVQLEEGRW